MPPKKQTKSASEQATAAYRKRVFVGVGSSPQAALNNAKTEYKKAGWDNARELETYDVPKNADWRDTDWRDTDWRDTDWRDTDTAGAATSVLVAVFAIKNPKPAKKK